MKVPAPASHKQCLSNNEARCDGHLLESLPQASFLGQGTKGVLVGVSPIKFQETVHCSKSRLAQ